jgi:hypothetical protein
MIQQRFQAMDDAYNSVQNSLSKQVSRFILDHIDTGFPNAETLPSH